MFKQFVFNPYKFKYRIDRLWFYEEWYLLTFYKELFIGFEMVSI